MSDPLKVLTVFIASPGDLADERRAAREVVEALNRAFETAAGLRVQLLGWEDTMPGTGRPQELINQDVDRADLFIGLLWHRWGTPPGHGNYTSGFQEELDRALQRRTRGAVPEVWIFFKEVDEHSKQDPGEDLKKVLAFRDHAITAKQFLFKDFKDSAQWKELLREYLLKHLLILQKAALPGAAQPASAVPLPPAAPQSTQVTKDKDDKWRHKSARKQIASALSAVREATERGEMGFLKSSKHLDSFHESRVALAAAALSSRDIEQDLIGPHLLNRLYEHREDLHPSPLELISILKTNIATSGKNTPGWFWARQAPMSMLGLLAYLATEDSNESVRKTATRLAADSGIELFAREPGQQSPIERILNHQDPDTRVAGLVYLARMGSPSHLSLLEPALRDASAEVQAQARLTQARIVAAKDPDAAFKDHVLDFQQPTDAILAIIEPFTTRLEASLLRRGLLHPEKRARTFSARALALRQLLTPQEIEALSGVDAAEVWQAHYQATINTGGQPTTSEIRAHLRPDWVLELTSARPGPNPDALIKDLFSHLELDQLKLIAISCSQDAPLAYGVLAERHFDAFGDQVRNDLKDGFVWLTQQMEKQTARRLKSPSDWILHFLDHDKQANAAREDFLLAALNGLAKNAAPTDRDLALAYLEGRSDPVTIAAVDALAKCGTLDDASRLAAMTETSAPHIAHATATAALRLSPGLAGPAAQFLRSPDKGVLNLALDALLPFPAGPVWKKLRDRLYDEDEAVRQLVCAFAVRKLSRPSLVKTLRWYTSPDRYFYNVVFYLDRILYAKPPLRATFTKQLTSVLK